MAIRLKSQWFKTDTPKTPQQAAGAMAFIVWRVAHNTLAQMRSAQFDIDIGPMYFDFMREWLVFLIGDGPHGARAHVPTSAWPSPALVQHDRPPCRQRKPARRAAAGQTATRAASSTCATSCRRTADFGHGAGADSRSCATWAAASRR
jgi:hypothetical protein